MGRDQKDKNVFRPYWLDEEDRDTFTKRKNKKYAEFWVDLYPRDILYLLKYPLVSGKMDPRDRQYIDTVWGGNLSVLLAWTDLS